jgi:excinuclease ABC subunit A
VLQKLVDSGNSVVVIEHNLDVIKTADWIVDLGPEGGPQGGELIASGTPEQIARTRGSSTARYLKPLLRRKPARKRKR